MAFFFYPLAEVGDRFFKKRAEFLEGNGDLLVLAIGAIGDESFLLFLIADHEGKGHFLDLAQAEAVAELFIAIIDLDAESVVLEDLLELMGVFPMDFGVDRQDLDLDGREPSGEGAAIVLGDDADEALDRAEDNAVQEVRFLLFAVLIDREAAEAVRQIDIELEGDIVRSARYTGGCHGNTQGIGALVAGMKKADVIARLEGINCKARGTSCPDQLARALKQL